IDDDRLRSSDRRQSSEERLKLALQGARQGTWDFDLQRQELVWDDRCKELFGLDPGAVVNYDTYLAGVYPDDRQRVADAAARAIRNCGEFAQEYRTVHSDGTSHWILTQGRCWCDPAGEPCRMSGTMMEITERKQVQLNDRFLYELTRRLRLITDADELQDEAARSVGEYLRFDRATWYGVDWIDRLATVERDWYRAGLESHVGVYAIADFLPPAMQVALFAGESVVISNIHTDPSLVPHLAAYRQLGLQAFVSMPCFNENQWVATLHVSTDQVRNWREDEIALLQTVAAQIWPTIEQTRAVAALRAQEEQTRAAQATIRQQLDEIEAIYQAAPIGLCFIDTDLKYVRINERLAQINGASVAAHIGQTLRELLPELADDVEPIYRQVIESGEPIVDLEVSGTNPAQPGVVRSWISSFYPQTDAENRTIGVNTVVQEITARKLEEAERQRIEADLRASERMRRFMFDQTFELLGLVDLDGVLLEVNQAALNSISARSSELVGRKFWETRWWTHSPQLQQQLIDAIDRAARGEVIRYEVEFPDGKGNVMITDFSLKPLFDEDGRIVKLIAEGRDISLRKQNQAILEERNRELDSFVYVVSHDLKAPLRAVANLSQWIEDDLAGQLTAATLTQITLLRNRVDRMMATIDGLLDYARVGRSEDAIEPVAMAQLLADVIDTLAPPPTFKIALPAELPTFSTRRLPLFQVFVNLVSNGIKHHHSEAGTIGIAIAQRGDWYEFAVSDDGSGIAPEHQERVFRIFQAVNPQKRSDSTGIGLAIVKKIVEAEGGTIRLESELGKGTTFYFTWPKG
uniref:PAS domain-containing protein n=1 Tax=Chamaesiphon sp. OTE_8_metabat_110 TaxID=2964696 RepID=UPI00286CEC09